MSGVWEFTIGTWKSHQNFLEKKVERLSCKRRYLHLPGNLWGRSSGLSCLDKSEHPVSWEDICASQRPGVTASSLWLCFSPLGTLWMSDRDSGGSVQWAQMISASHGHMFLFAYQRSLTCRTVEVRCVSNDFLPCSLRFSAGNEWKRSSQLKGWPKQGQMHARVSTLKDSKPSTFK